MGWFSLKNILLNVTNVTWEWSKYTLSKCNFYCKVSVDIVVKYSQIPLVFFHLFWVPAFTNVFSIFFLDWLVLNNSRNKRVSAFLLYFIGFETVSFMFFIKLSYFGSNLFCGSFLRDFLYVLIFLCFFSCNSMPCSAGWPLSWILLVLELFLKNTIFLLLFLKCSWKSFLSQMLTKFIVLYNCHHLIRSPVFEYLTIFGWNL